MLSETVNNARERAQHNQARGSGHPQSSMRVRKRRCASEPVDVHKTVRALNRCCFARRVSAYQVGDVVLDASF